MTCCAECFAAVDPIMVSFHAKWHRETFPGVDPARIDNWEKSWEGRR